MTEPEPEDSDLDCPTCGGSGGGEGYWRCPDCAGSGRRRTVDEDALAAEADYAYDRWKDDQLDKENK